MTSGGSERQPSFLGGPPEQPQFKLPESPFMSDPLLRDLKTTLLSRREWQERPTRDNPLTLVADLRNEEGSQALIDPNQAWQKTSTPGVEIRDNRLGALLIISPPIDSSQMRQIKNLIGLMIRPLKYRSPIIILDENPTGFELVEPLTPEEIKNQLRQSGVVGSKTLTSKKALDSLAETHRLTLARAPAPKKKWPKEKEPPVRPATATTLQNKFCSSKGPFPATPEHNVDLYPPTNKPGTVYEGSQGEIFVVTKVEIRPGEIQFAGIRELKPSERSSY